MVTIVNLTPHAITVRTDAGDRTFQPCGTVARVSQDTMDAGFVAGIPVVKKTTGQVTGLPDPAADTVYIVSAMVLAAVSDRSDVFAPDTGSTAIRNDKGHIVAVRGFVAVNK